MAVNNLFIKFQLYYTFYNDSYDTQSTSGNSISQTTNISTIFRIAFQILSPSNRQEDAVLSFNVYPSKHVCPNEETNESRFLNFRIFRSRRRREGKF